MILRNKTKSNQTIEFNEMIHIVRPLRTIDTGKDAVNYNDAAWEEVSEKKNKPQVKTNGKRKLYSI